ncbi:MAG TPA: hypothetical protein VK619_04705, partial [Pyrinomonadaceae bacterium]|nr:hypothetical protein [Pyrinomonadaceae bacterium]
MNAKRIAFVVFIILLTCLQARAAVSLADYRERVRRAASYMETLPASEESESRAAYEARSARTIQNVRALLPATETVEWNGTQANVDNSWLDEALKNYAQVPANDPRRAEEAGRIGERLRAIEEHISEMMDQQSAGVAKTQTKEEAKAKLSSILRRDEYQERSQQQSALSRFWQRFLKWLRDL